MVAIKTDKLSKHFDKLKAVDAIDLEIEEGELFGFLGPNGAGKTTTISMLSTILKPTSGSAIVDGHDIIKEQTKVRRSIGIVFQEQSLDDELTARENLKFHARLYKVSGEDYEKRSAELLALMELTDRADDLVKTYSGGMRRRLEIARGLLHHPNVLFLDEPTLGLDPQTRRLIWEYVQKLNKEKNVTMLLTTHYMEEADFLCDRIAIIDHGKIVALDTPKGLKDTLGGDAITIFTDAKDEKIIEDLKKIEGVNDVQFIKDGIRITARQGETVIPRALDVLRADNITIRSVSFNEPTLEDVFIKYTGRKLRDEAEGKKANLKRHMRQRGRMRH